jgi:mannosyltransferase OCH1-like enzyme
MAPRPRTKSANLRGREPVYLLLFLLLMVYHHYSAHSTVLLHTLPVTPPYNEGSSLPSMNTATTNNRADDAVPLEQLTTSPISSCPPPLIYLPNHVRTEAHNRKIPKIVHMTSKSRCFTSNFYENIQQWRHMEEHSLYLHDDTAVDRLLSQDWPLFPHMNLARKCLRSGAGLADLWRYVVLWEYGGIYTGKFTSVSWRVSKCVTSFPWGRDILTGITCNDFTPVPPVSRY